MKIGELAAATTTKVETVRYYEKIGLLSPPARTSSNYRAYGNDRSPQQQKLRQRLLRQPHDDVPNGRRSQIYAQDGVEPDRPALKERMP